MALRLGIVTTRSGHTGVEVEGVAYHSLYNPEREAEKFYGPKPIEKANVILHFGWGLGYSGPALREHLKRSARVLVFEPDEELFKMYRDLPGSEKILQDSRFKFIVGTPACQFFDDWSLDACQETDEFLSVMRPAAYPLQGNLADKLPEKCKIHLRDKAANLLTHFNNGRFYFDNVLETLIFKADVGCLFGRFKDVPLVIPCRSEPT